MRQVGMLAAAGIYALDHIAPKLQVDHANAQILAKGQQYFSTVFHSASPIVCTPCCVFGQISGLNNQSLHTPY